MHGLEEGLALERHARRGVERRQAPGRIVGPRPHALLDVGVAREIAATDIAAVFQRYGIDLIAERIESEEAVLEALDLDAPYGQGHLFGAPRPIKESLLEETQPPREIMLARGRVA